MLEHKNREDIQILSEGFLQQAKLENDDFLLLRHNDFERILIFDREAPSFFDGEDVPANNQEDSSAVFKDQTVSLEFNLDDETPTDE